MKTLLTFTIIFLLFTSCIKEESPSKVRSLIENSTNENVSVEAFDSLGTTSKLYDISAKSQYIISDWIYVETVPNKALFYEEYDSIYVKIGDSTTVHYNRNIIKVETKNRLAFTNPKNFFYNGWELITTKMSKKKQDGNYSVESIYKIE